MKPLHALLIGALCAAIPAFCQTAPAGVYKSNWKGMLVDAGCKPQGMSSSSSQSSSQSDTTRNSESATRNSTSTETSKSSASSSTNPDTGTSTSSRSEEQSTAERSSTTNPETGATSQSSRTEKHSSERSSGASVTKSSSNPGWDMWMSCPVSSTTTMFALVMPDGKVARFDSVGNVRAQQAFLNNHKWAGRSPLQVKVGGWLEGDKMVVDSIR